MDGLHSDGEGGVAQQGEDHAVMTVVASHYMKAPAEEVVHTEGQKEVHEAAGKVEALGEQWAALGVLAGQAEEVAPLGLPWELQ